MARAGSGPEERYALRSATSLVRRRAGSATNHFIRARAPGDTGASPLRQRRIVRSSRPAIT